MEEESEQAKGDQEFKAVKAPVPYHNPFPPARSTKPLTATDNVVLHSDLRSRQRARFERLRQKRADYREAACLEIRAMLRAEEAEQVAALRRTMVHKAQPIGYKVHTYCNICMLCIAIWDFR